MVKYDSDIIAIQINAALIEQCRMQIQEGWLFRYEKNISTT